MIKLSFSRLSQIIFFDRRILDAIDEDEHIEAVVAVIRIDAELVDDLEVVLQQSFMLMVFE